jgi:hypothetical protein
VILLASEMDRRSLEQGVRPDEAREVRIHLGDGAEVSAGYASTGLVNYFDTTYQTLSPQVGARNLIAREVVELGSLVPLDAATGTISSGSGDQGIQRRPLPQGYRRGGIERQDDFYDDGSGGFHG